MPYNDIIYLGNLFANGVLYIGLQDSQNNLARLLIANSEILKVEINKYITIFTKGCNSTTSTFKHQVEFSEDNYRKLKNILKRT